MISDLSRIIDQVGKDKGIDKTILIDALEQALLAAARKKYGPKQEIEAKYNEEAGELELFQFKTVVKDVKNPPAEISWKEAKELDADVEIGDSLGTKIDIAEFGRIAAQTAKQVIIQRVKDAERENIFEDFKDRKGEVISGTVQRFEKGSIIVNLGRAEAVIPQQELVPRETYKPGDRIRAYVLDVRKTPKGPQIILSRSNPNFLTKLFELEVPEVSEGIVKILNAAREPGSRAKIAVYSQDSDVDPVGACVGMKGSRVQAVVQELRGEKIDIIPWSDDSASFVCNALAPAEISKVIIHQDAKSMEVVVEDDQLSLAIGRRGQNVRLAAKLTDWKIDIRSEPKAERVVPDLDQIASRGMDRVDRVAGVGEKTAQLLNAAGYLTVADICQATPEQLSKIEGIGLKKAEKMIDAAKAHFDQTGEKK
ncbi:MAG: transcription termination factor NusA [Deltaproteobacteria bacterium]|jgi:N utilization substance protein A|nr:transcription termination factor NusA [Deltaproteobacteria bacterium]